MLNLHFAPFCHLLFTSFSLWVILGGCQPSSSGGETANSTSPDKKEIEKRAYAATVSYYLEFADNIGNGLSKKVLSGVEKELTSQAFVQHKDLRISKINKFDNFPAEELNVKKPNIHRFINIKNVNASNTPGNKSIKMVVRYLDYDEKDEHIELEILAFCKKGRVEWWQCKNFGKFSYPTAEDKAKGIKSYKPEQFIEKITEKVAQLSFVEN
ncbi:MAG TPA: hypothetical protein DCM08_10350 [Microscillaceae bacterium]|jgi:hypothetical protein|nr:hypothetical protein [Microscillaceae bacterium]